MAETITVKPDAAFIKELLGSGGSDLKKCYQCATCSVACNVCPENAPFPRKQMALAQWGMKEQLLSDPAVWLCHNCGDCSTLCPRGARPGDVFGALRKAAIEKYSFPGFMAKLAGKPSGLLPLLLLPVLIFAAIVLFAPRDITVDPEFANLFPQNVLEPLFFAISGIVLLAFGVGLARFIKALKRAGADAPIVPNLIPAAIEIMAHSRFKKCGAERARYWGHMLTLWGFAGLAFMGTVVGIGTMAGVMQTPLPFMWDPGKPVESALKIFANVCAVVILAGLVIILFDRVADKAKRAASTYFDWLFLLALTGVVLTGILSELMRLLGQDPSMFYVYFVHLVLVLMLFLYAPYTKFAHIAYRTVAMAASRK